MMKYLVWPAAFVVFAIFFVSFFRHNIRTILDRIAPLLDRVRKAGPLEMTPAPTSEQVTAVENAASAAHVPSPLENQVLRLREEAIRSDLDTRVPNNPDAQREALITHLAATQLVLSFEVINRLIWGSQIDLLLHVNTRPEGTTRNELQPFYETAVAQHPGGLQDYPYDRYLNFLVSQGLLVSTNNTFQITAFGQEFLAHLARTRATYRRPF
jgi:hypothetical protein